MLLPDYSVLMSVYVKENAKWLLESLNSIVEQSYSPNEIVLVCDGPLTEALNKAIEDFSNWHPGLMKIIRLNKNMGLGKALSVGLEHCSNEYVARMDTDDISMPSRCEKQLSLMIQDGLDIVSSPVLEFYKSTGDSSVMRDVPESHEEILEYAKFRNPFNHPAIVFKKSCVKAAGGYQDLPFAEDYYLWVRMLANGCRSANVKDPLVYMRMNEGSYERRGGTTLLRSLSRLYRYMIDRGFLSRSEYSVNMFKRTVVTLIPSSLRREAYNRLARERR